MKGLRSFFLLPLLFFAQQLTAQTLPTDSSKRIEIISGNSIRFITLDDSTGLRTIAGNAVVKQGNTKLSGDSIVLNSRTNIAEVFGHVHINDADTVNTYADYLRYVGKERIAYLKRNVKLTDGKASLVTNDLVYNVATGIANYQGGGKVINGSSVLTSTDATYYSDTKDVFFKKQVHLVDPKYNIVADSLRYNTGFKIATLISPTLIKTKDGKIIRSKNGTYNLQTGEAQFFDRTMISDSTTTAIADEMFFDETTGIAILNRRAKFVDSANHIIVIANRIETNRKTNSFLATEKPVVIIVKDKDSTYIAADTLFSGLRKYDNSFNKMVNKVDTVKAKKVISDNEVTTKNKKLLDKKDSIQNKIQAVDSSKKEYVKLDSIKKYVKDIMAEPTDSLQKKDSSKNQKAIGDTLKNNPTPTAISNAILQKKDTSKNFYTKVDTLNNQQIFTKTPQDSIRYILGYNHVRIYNDSSQAVCDSMYYSTEDSVFRMFRNPIVWKQKNQIMGDTMYLFTEKQQPKRIYVFNNSIVINQQNPAMYNQAGGRTLNAYFTDGKINYARIKGSPAETIFYAQDADSAFVGMNRCSGDVADVYFAKEEVIKIKFINNIDGVMYPLKQIPTDKKYLKNFKWEDKRRPKNKLELFE
jgi:lipopolysaccharide export system protein LptA